jgi:hypothetical protein
MIDHRPVKDTLISNDPWAVSHGYIASCGFLGTNLLYYTLAYMLPALTAVVLGSGGGVVPRFIAEAQRDIPDSTFQKKRRLILIDADNNDKGFGAPLYHNNPDHPLHKNFPEIEVWKMTTDEAISHLKQRGLEIDYLHIDADHTFIQSLKDLEGYLPLMSEDFIITLHDTALGHLEMHHDGCIPRLIAHLRKEMEKGGRYEHLEMINFNLRKMQKTNFFQKRLDCCGTAIIKPKVATMWDKQMEGLSWLAGTT